MRFFKQLFERFRRKENQQSENKLSEKITVDNSISEDIKLFKAVWELTNQLFM